MSQSYEVVTDALSGHARTLRDLAAELGQAADTAAGVELTADACGLIGQPFVTAVAALARAGQEVLRTDVEALESAGTALSDTVTAYLGQEADEAARFGAIGRGTAPGAQA
ncbi:type VII secretion target [Umezawaea sp.]|uniref:type VII secretion target n=1 Tax=Umezawaea sp. TaxID=1955258 RepID=UPI002ED581A6